MHAMFHSFVDSVCSGAFVGVLLQSSDYDRASNNEDVIETLSWGFSLGVSDLNIIINQSLTLQCDHVRKE